MKGLFEMSAIKRIKSFVKNTPLIGKLAEKVYRQFVPGPEKYIFTRFGWEKESQESGKPEVQQILNLLNYTKTSGASYAAKKYPAGYHSLEIEGSIIKGQRDPFNRLKRLEIDFAGLRVLDIGCNQGGMLFSLYDRIKWGVGVDYDYRLINCCSKIGYQTGKNNKLSFYSFNIDHDPHEIILDMLPEPVKKVDVVFLLAVCMWVEKWREIIDLCAAISPVLVFESNGSPEVQAGQIAHVKSRYSEVEMIEDSNNGNRQLMVARNDP